MGGVLFFSTGENLQGEDIARSDMISRAFSMRMPMECQEED